MVPPEARSEAGARAFAALEELRATVAAAVELPNNHAGAWPVAAPSTDERPQQLPHLRRPRFQSASACSSRPSRTSLPRRISQTNSVSMPKA